MKNLFKKIFFLGLLTIGISCGKDVGNEEKGLDLSQYRLVYTYRARTWQAKKDHIYATYVDFLNKTQAESFGSATFNYRIDGNRVSYTDPSENTFSFDVDLQTMAVSNLTSDKEDHLEYQIQKLQKKDGSQSLVNKKYSGLYSYNQDTDNILKVINFKFSDSKFVKYGLILGAEPDPELPIKLYAENTAFRAENLPTGEVFNGVLIDGRLYAQWTVLTSPYAFWGQLSEVEN